jgi:2-C-methyl-D-erythritol 4-phosphate cytidylyltransferase
MKVTAIVPSAGTGERIQHRLKKPYISLLGQPILAHTLKILNSVSAINQIIVPVYPGEENFCEKEVVKKMSLTTEVKIVAGGETRQESVRKALGFLPGSCDTVLIHDSARPLISRSMIEDSIEATKTKRATAMGVPVKDTITIVSKDDQTIAKTLARDSLYLIQTPQTFERDLIVNAHQIALHDGFKGTDDASLVERLGIPVTVITGSYTNIKITTKEDLLSAEAIMRNGFDSA